MEGLATPGDFLERYPPRIRIHRPRSFDRTPEEPVELVVIDAICPREIDSRRGGCIGPAGEVELAERLRRNQRGKGAKVRAIEPDVAQGLAEEIELRHRRESQDVFDGRQHV